MVVDALIKANKDFDLLLFPNAAHGYGSGSLYMTRRRWDYFVRYLAGNIPPPQYRMKSYAAAMSAMEGPGGRYIRRGWSRSSSIHTKGRTGCNTLPGLGHLSSEATAQPFRLRPSLGAVCRSLPGALVNTHPFAVLVNVACATIGPLTFVRSSG